MMQEVGEEGLEVLELMVQCWVHLVHVGLETFDSWLTFEQMELKPLSHPI